MRLKICKEVTTLPHLPHYCTNHITCLFTENTVGLYSEINAVFCNLKIHRFMPFTLSYINFLRLGYLTFAVNGYSLLLL